MGSKYEDIRYKWLDERGIKVLGDPHQLAYSKSLFAPVSEIQGVFCEAAAGTGKTALATLIGAYGVMNGDYDKIIYIRDTSVVGEQLGFLPGDEGEKVAPHMQPFVDALDLVQPGLYEKWSLEEEKKVFAITSTYTRGVTFDNAYVILDESQNNTLLEFQTLNTRPTSSCKIVTIGSLRQVDNDKLRRYYGYTPFEIFMMHYEGRSVRHELVTNYRGDWSRHADNIQDTLDRLKVEAEEKAATRPY